MKDQILEIDENEDLMSKQRGFNRLLEMYYNANINNYANVLKKCIPDIESPYQSRFIKKIDRAWLQANLNKVYQKSSEKLEKNLLSKNLNIKNHIQSYQKQFQNACNDKKFHFLQGKQQIFQKQQTQGLRRKLKYFGMRKRNDSYPLSIINSQPSSIQNQVPSRSMFSSKKTFRVRQHKPNLNQIINNTRYIEKLQKIKLQSTFTQLFFTKDANPQNDKTFIQLQKKCINKLKIMTNVRGNFNFSQKNFKDSMVPQYSIQVKQKINNFFIVQRHKQNSYKPKSKCKQRSSKIFLNF